MRKLKKYINRKQSVVTGKRNLEHLYTLKNFPVFFGCVDTSPKNDLVADMVWGIDLDTGVIQLTKLIPLEILYQAQHFDGCGPTWQTYYDDFSKHILSKNPKSVLEIGGGQGQLAETTTRQAKDLKWIIVEPNPKHSGNKQIEIISAFFDKDFKFNKKVDIVVFSQLLEHVYNPREFLQSIARFIKPGGFLIFAYPNLTLLLKRKYTNAINFEHTMFLTNYFVDYLLKEVGFTIDEKIRHKEHSYFYTVSRSKKPNKAKFKNRYSEYKKIFLDFVNYHEKMVKDINKKMAATKKPVYCFGAHIFTTFLLAFGLEREKIISILDNSPTKQGKRLYGTDLMVESPKILEDKGEVNLILKAGLYNKEIKKDILQNINSQVTFW